MTSENIRLPEMDMRTIVGKEIIVGDRSIWPVMRISILKTYEDRIQAIRITPLAMLITEPAGQYAVSFEGEPMTIEAILELALPLKDVLEKARGSARIKVD
ncbi:MAG: hypothetical protein M0Q43_07915 [Methanothrix sp.]|jgi:uncharacterized spore protein YtfJ|nr:hypothetical protein [Methanothrix sp.]